ncbi:MAG: hypothetical protein PHU21_05525 [Elusimicrobia bacterium]|nr:hypothetical protein [Elusimicrobiota bacterium]
MRKTGFLLLLAVVCLGCAQPGSRVEHDPAADLSRYRRVGVAPFVDRRGQGPRITEGLQAGLRGLLHGGADQEVVAAILREHKPDREFGLSVEALELLRVKASADAILIGSLSSDGKAASLTLVDLETGEAVLRAALRPPGRKQKAFAGPEEVVAESLRVLAVLAR